MRDGHKAAAIIRERGGSVDVGLVLGSGLGPIADALTGPVEIAYAELPGFPRPTVGGHPGTLAIGTLGKTRVAAFQGRAHFYETGDVSAMRTPLEALAAL